MVFRKWAGVRSELSAGRHSAVVSISLFVLQTLYKTQVRELKEECEEKNKLYKEVQQALQDQQEER